MTYFYNPKMKDSGLIACIPQSGRCPNECPDCFFQSGRSYLEPLEENLPNMPTLDQVGYRVVRVNDGNDSTIDMLGVIKATKRYPLKFYNTSLYRPPGKYSPFYDLAAFPAPVVLTVNPGKMTDTDFHRVYPIPKNLMFVRVRTNTWNLGMVDNVVEYYTIRRVPVVLTFMAYFDQPIPDRYKEDYVFRGRTINMYHAITTRAWRYVMARYNDDHLVYSCGKEGITTLCKHCGNCLREFFATRERMEE